MELVFHTEDLSSYTIQQVENQESGDQVEAEVKKMIVKINLKQSNKVLKFIERDGTQCYTLSKIQKNEDLQKGTITSQLNIQPTKDRIFTFYNDDNKQLARTLVEYHDTKGSNIKKLIYENSKIELSENNDITISNCKALLANGDSFEGVVKNAQIFEGVLQTYEESVLISIKSKFSNGIPFGFTEISKPNYKFLGLLRKFDPKSPKSSVRGLIDPIYGQITSTTTDSDTNTTKTQTISGLFSNKGKISTPAFYDKITFLKQFDLEKFNIQSDIKFFSYNRQEGSKVQALDSTYLDIEYLEKNSEFLMEKLDDQNFLRENFVFSTIITSEYIFHGCMKDYNGQNFSLLCYPDSGQTFIGNFSPKMILDFDGVFYYQPKNIEKSEEDGKNNDNNPPFKYTGGFKNSLFDGVGTLEFSGQDQKMEFQGQFKAGKRHGPGTLRKDGEVVVQGEWSEDKFLEDEKQKEKEKSGLETSGSFAEFDQKLRESLQQQSQTKGQMDQNSKQKDIKYSDRDFKFQGYTDKDDFSELNNNSRGFQLNTGYSQCISMDYYNYFNTLQVLLWQQRMYMQKKSLEFQSFTKIKKIELFNYKFNKFGKKMIIPGCVLSSCLFQIKTNMFN